MDTDMSQEKAVIELADCDSITFAYSIENPSSWVTHIADVMFKSLPAYCGK